MASLPTPLRVASAIAALGAFVVGIWMGLVRIGVSLGNPPAAGTHGAMLVLGFLGTVIGMERAVATGRTWAWATPLSAAAGAAALLLDAPVEVAAALFLVAAAVLTALFATVYRRRPEPHVLLMGMGAGAWFAGTVTWIAGRPLPAIVPWLAAFLVLTIAGERLELARTIGTSAGARLLLGGAVAVVVVGSMGTWIAAPAGARLAGLGNLLVALWLLRYDVARRTVRLGGVTRYMATGLLVGYGWLALSGVLWITSGLDPAAPAYDAALHSLFLGFVMSMIMAHAPVVIPALTGLAFPFTPALWGPLGLLHVSLAIRVLGDATNDFGLHRWGAILDAVALGWFLLLVGFVVARARTATGRPVRRRHSRRRGA